jgi:CheY-like chemotaxis protein
MLENAGAAVTEASDGLEGLRAIQQLGAVPDLVVTDLMMPMLGGREVADVLAVFCPELPVLCLSGYPPPGDALYDGALDRRLCHLQKPFTPDELIEAARRTMARKRVARAITEEQRTAARRVWEAVAGDVPRPEGCTLTADLVTAARELRRLAQGGGA